MTILKNIVKRLYPEAYSKIYDFIDSELQNSSIKNDNKEWYKEMNLYVVYPDSFCDDNKCDLSTLEGKIPYLKDLGFNAIHVLPFLKSPMIDMGFDVSNYLSVRYEIGGNEAFDKLIETAQRNNINIFADIILNHVSYRHDWFQKAVSGDLKYRDYFAWSKTRPEFIKKFKDEDGVWARYLIDNEERDIYVIFPEQCGEIPHWYKAEDGNWYYHTFYPHQIDTNWSNADVFLEYAKILMYWARKGVSFRLDAIPFIGKDIKNGLLKDDNRTHLIVTALNIIVKTVNEHSIFLAEACVPSQDLKKYFETDGIVESECCYNFDLSVALWIALLTGETSKIWEVLNKHLEDIPDFACWVNFLRNHDEVSLEEVEPEIRKELYEKMAKGGLGFRDGFGVSGRTASFLDGNPAKIVCAYFLLDSLPGVPAVIYGDEIGKENDFDYMKLMTQKKIETSGDKNIKDDTRDINRGQIKNSELMQPHSQKIYSDFCKVFNARNECIDFFNVKPEKIETKKGVFSCIYKVENKELVVLVNLNDYPLELEVNNGLHLKASINGATYQKGVVQLSQYGGIWLSNS
ncbi:hypothetical protein JW710_01010 [Candidatus Dojkabacteria bacterium]|nr:hypothetical protein [Candidatus Dojkabacteria bacterium]